MMLNILSQIDGAMPGLTEFPLGCPFHPRCGVAMEVCRQDTPLCSDVSTLRWPVGRLSRREQK
ncbi:MAG: hypothetical protein Ct9H300mP13_2280 [Gammaproteobacteria bacterium]|nr:MAG: hypothetical protein Ct9H300mP13_2280 [Gammaproteobacteria bacterium]